MNHSNIWICNYLIKIVWAAPTWLFRFCFVWRLMFQCNRNGDVSWITRGLRQCDHARHLLVPTEKNGRKMQPLVAVWSPAFFSIKHMNAGAGIPLASFSANLQVVWCVCGHIPQQVGANSLGDSTSCGVNGPAQSLTISNMSDVISQSDIRGLGRDHWKKSCLDLDIFSPETLQD